MTTTALVLGLQTVVSTLFSAKTGEQITKAAQGTRIGESLRAIKSTVIAGLTSKSVEQIGSWLGGFASSTAGSISTLVTGATTALTSWQTYKSAAGYTWENVKALAGMVGGTVVTLASTASLMMNDGTVAKVSGVIRYAGGALLLTSQGIRRMSEGEFKRGTALMGLGVISACGAVVEGQDLYTQLYPAIKEDEEVPTSGPQPRAYGQYQQGTYDGYSGHPYHNVSSSVNYWNRTKF